MKNKNGGYLLIEALIALSLLALGVAAVSDAFSGSRAAMQRGAFEKTLAGCAQEKILDDITGAAVNFGCDQLFTWRSQATPLSPGIEAVVWTASWERDGKIYEEKFETVRAARV